MLFKRWNIVSKTKRCLKDKVLISFQVNSNGHLSFETELPGYQPTLVLPLEMNVKVIAAFLADVDTSVAGKVYYR